MPVRRTLSLPLTIDALVRANARPGESYSATAARLIAAGADAPSRQGADWIGIAEGPSDLGLRAEHYLRETVDAHERDERPR